jgi:hypothetical protein
LGHAAYFFDPDHFFVLDRSVALQVPVPFEAFFGLALFSDPGRIAFPAIP